MKRRLAAILSADMKGCSRLMGGDAAAEQDLERLRRAGIPERAPRPERNA